MLNHIVLMGRLTRDPELRRTGSGVAVASFTLAVDRDFAAQGAEKETDFVDIVAWRNTAEFVSQLLRQGAYGCGDGQASDPQLDRTRKATSAARQRSWQTTSTSATPSATMPTAARSTSRRASTQTPSIRSRSSSPPIRRRQNPVCPLRPASPCSPTTIPISRSDRLFPNECFHTTR